MSTTNSAQVGQSASVTLAACVDLRIVSGGEGHSSIVAQGASALPANHASAQTINGGGEGHRSSVAQAARALPAVALIVETYRLRQDLHRAEKRLTLQVKATCRRYSDGDKGEADKLYKRLLAGTAGIAALLVHLLPLLAARKLIETERGRVERKLRKLARTLPVWGEWMAGVRGVSDLGLGILIGEAGDIGRFSNPAKLWKRMGVGLVGDSRQRLVTDPELAELHGYNPARRSALWTIGDAIIKAGGPYREVYDARKLREVEKAAEDGLLVATSTAATADAWEATGIPRPTVVSKIDQKLHRSCGHIHLRAKRYAEKRLLRDLWRAWRREPMEEERPGGVTAPAGPEGVNL